MRTTLIAAAFATLLSSACAAPDTRSTDDPSRSTPTDPRYRSAWRKFYFGSSAESEIASPLVRVGEPIVPSICRAVTDPNMRRRRYAIAALGYIRDRRALPTLTAILADTREVAYFRADALEAIYRIAASTARRHASDYVRRQDLLGTVARAAVANDGKYFNSPDE
jgi:HEAT repeat protein